MTVVPPPRLRFRTASSTLSALAMSSCIDGLRGVRAPLSVSSLQRDLPPDGAGSA
jgi:hypothetical protein